MTKTIMFLITGIAAATLIGGQAFAGMVPGFSSVDELEDGKVLFGFKRLISATFEIDENTPVPRHGEVFGGYGVLTTDGSLLVVTSHAGFYDSEVQIPPTTDDTLSSYSEVCLDADDGNLFNAQAPSCGPEWHTHLANLAADDETCEPNENVDNARLQVAALTFEEPSGKVIVRANEIVLQNIEKGSQAFTESVTGQIMDFDLGPYAGALVSFNLVPRGDPFPVCVEDITPIEVKAHGITRDI